MAPGDDAVDFDTLEQNRRVVIYRNGGWDGIQFQCLVQAGAALWVRTVMNTAGTW